MSGLDYPQAWAFVKATKPEDHDPRCSWRTENGALLCDCDVIWDEHVRRGGNRSTSRRVYVNGPDGEPIYAFLEDRPWTLEITNDDGQTVKFSVSEVYAFALLLKEIRPNIEAWLKASAPL